MKTEIVQKNTAKLIQKIDNGEVIDEWALIGNSAGKCISAKELLQPRDLLSLPFDKLKKNYYNQLERQTDEFQINLSNCSDLRKFNEILEEIEIAYALRKFSKLFELAHKLHLVIASNSELNPFFNNSELDFVMKAVALKLTSQLYIVLDKVDKYLEKSDIKLLEE